MAKVKTKRRPRDPSIEGLTYKQRQFVSFYLGEAKGNATDAARRAGYSNAEIGRQLLRNITIRAAIDAKLASAAMASDEVLARLSEIASVDVGDFLSFTGNGYPFVNLSRARKAGKTHLIRKLKPTMHGMQIEMADPLSALDKLARYHGLYGEKTLPADPTRGPRIVIPASDERSAPQDEG